MFVSKWLVVGITGLLVSVLMIFVFVIQPQAKLVPINVGVLFSLTGSIALTEKPLADVTLMAIEEINKKGGVLGRKLNPIVVDGKSDTEQYKKEALNLIQRDKVAAIFGVWRSSTRKALKDILEKNDNILFYPANDEGLEESPNIVYMGSMPNQVILPAIAWGYNNLGKKFFVVGSKDLFPITIYEIIRFHLASLGAELAGAEFVTTQDQIPSVVEKIVSSKPEVIINILQADMNIPFFKKLREAGISSEKIPSISFDLTEVELRALEIPLMVGDYAAWTYFQTIGRDENRRFVKNFKKRYGESTVVNAIMESAYANVNIWANAVRDAQTTAIAELKKHLELEYFNAPGGIVYLDDRNQHSWRTAYIGRILYNGQFDIVWTSKKQIKPLIFPPYQTKEYWDNFVKKTIKELESHA